jgi:hypothetical protein
MTWLSLNLLLAAPFVVIWVGVPMWLVLKHPDQGARPPATSSDQSETATSPAPKPPDRARRRAVHGGQRLRQA